MKRVRTVSLNVDQEVNDPKQATIIQLEMIQQRAISAIDALKKGHKHNFQEQVKRLKQEIIRVHNLTQQTGPYDDTRLVTMLRESGNDAQIASDTSDGLIEVNGQFNLNKLSKRLLW